MIIFKVLILFPKIGIEWVRNVNHFILRNEHDPIPEPM